MGRRLRGGEIDDGGRAGGGLRWFRRSPLRRVFAALLAVAVLAFSFEPLIADVHDGDAAVSTLAQASALIGGCDDAAHADLVAHAPVAALGAGRVQQTDQGVAQGPHAPPTSAPVPHHVVHVCHGVHEHAAALPDIPVAIATIAVAVPVAGARPYTEHSLSRTAEPPVRPPIA